MSISCVSSFHFLPIMVYWWGKAEHSEGASWTDFANVAKAVAEEGAMGNATFVWEKCWFGLLQSWQRSLKISLKDEQIKECQIQIMLENLDQFEMEKWQWFFKAFQGLLVVRVAYKPWLGQECPHVPEALKELEADVLTPVEVCWVHQPPCGLSKGRCLRNCMEFPCSPGGTFPSFALGTFVGGFRLNPFSPCLW